MSTLEKDIQYTSSVIAEPPHDLRYARRSLILFGLMVLLVYYIEMMMTASIPKILIEYHETLGKVSLILALYTIFGVALIPVVGKLGDIHGKKKVLMYVLVAYSIMVVSTSLTPNFTWLLISRTFQGVGITISPLALTLAREQYPRKMIAKAQGLISGMIFAGIGLGLSAGALVSEYWGWQTNYHIAAPIIIILTILTWLYIKESRFKNYDIKLDIPGSAILGSSLALFVLGLSQATRLGWMSPLILGFFFGGGILLIPLYVFENKVSQPILDFSRLGEKNILVSNIIAFITGTAIVLSFASLVYKLEDTPPAGYGFSIGTAGMYILPFAIIVLITSYPIGALNSKYGVKPFLFLGGIIGAVGSILLAFETIAYQIPIFLCITAVGFSMLLISRQVMLIMSVNNEDMGTMVSISQIFFNMGQSVAPAISASILSAYAASVIIGGESYSLPTHQAFGYIFWFVAVIFMISFLLAPFGKEVIGKRQADLHNTSLRSSSKSPK